MVVGFVRKALVALVGVSSVAISSQASEPVYSDGPRGSTYVTSHGRTLRDIGGAIDYGMQADCVTKALSRAGLKGQFGRIPLDVQGDRESFSPLPTEGQSLRHSFRLNRDGEHFSTGFTLDRSPADVDLSKARKIAKDCAVTLD